MLGATDCMGPHMMKDRKRNRAGWRRCFENVWPFPSDFLPNVNTNQQPQNPAPLENQRTGSANLFDVAALPGLLVLCSLFRSLLLFVILQGCGDFGGCFSRVTRGGVDREQLPARLFSPPKVPAVQPFQDFGTCPLGCRWGC